MEEKVIYQTLYEELKKIDEQLGSVINSLQDLNGEVENSFSCDRNPYMGKDLLETKRKIEELEKRLSQDILLEVSRLR